MRVDEFAELFQHEFATAILAAEQSFVLGDVGAQAGGFVFELELGERGEATQRHVEDVRGLDDRQLETFNEAIASLAGVLRRANDGDHLVDRIEGDQETLEDVEAILRLLQSELSSADDDLEAMLDVGPAQVVEPERGGHAVDKHHIVDAERLLERGEAIQLLEHRLRVDGRLHIDLDHEAVHVGQVSNAFDTDKLAAVGELLNLADHPLRTHEVGQFGDDDRLAIPGGLLHVRFCPDAERAAARLIGVAQAVVDDDAARRKVGAGQHGHEVVDRRLGPTLGHDDLDRIGDLAQVVRGHVGGHADRNAAGAVDENVGQRRRQHDRLIALTVVGGAEIDRVLVEFADHVHRRLGQPALGVTRSSGRIVERTEIALRIDERNHPREVLAHAGQGVVDGGIAVRVVAAHRVAHDASRLAIRRAGTDAHLQHRPENAALHWLEAVAHIGNGTRRDDREGVGEETLAHLLGNGDLHDFASEPAVEFELSRHGADRSQGL